MQFTAVYGNLSFIAVIFAVIEFYHWSFTAMPKKIVPLTDIKLSSAKPKEKQVSMSDGDGLRFIITPKNRKFFRFDYTRPKTGGKRNSITIGDYPTISLKEARDKRQEFRTQVEHGIDPADIKKDFLAEKVKEQEEIELNEKLLFENISKSYLEKEKKSIAKSTYITYERYVRYMNEEFGKNKNINDITVEDISNLITYYDIVKDQQETALRTLQCLKRVYRYAKNRGLIEHNITSDLEPSDLISKKDIQHFSHVTSEKDFFDVLKAINNYNGDPIVTLALKYQSMTFLRPANVRGLRWEIVDYKKMLITYPKEEMKGENGKKRPHSVPITTQMKELLDQAAKLTKGRSIYVFASPQATQYNDKTLSENTLNQALHRLGFKGVMTSHGFRHTASTLLNENHHEHGASGDVVEMMLAHKEPGIRGTYNHAKYINERTRLAQWWCNYIDKIQDNFDETE